MKFSSHLPLLALLVSCSETSPVATVRETYSCCEPECLNTEHLATVETYDPAGQLIKRMEYLSGLPGKVARSVTFAYEGSRLAEVQDSGEFHFIRTEYSYEKGTLSSATTFNSHATVYNEVLDTVPHTQWGTRYDTSVMYFSFYKERMVKKVQEWKGDTLSVVDYLYDVRNRLMEQTEGTNRRRFYYNESDSLIKVELISYSVSDADVTSTTPRWEVFGYTEIQYDSTGRRLAEHTFDDLDIEMHQVRYSYDDLGRLASQRWDSTCDTIVYRR